MVNDINEFCWLPESDAWLFGSGLESCRRIPIKVIQNNE